MHTQGKSDRESRMALTSLHAADAPPGHRIPLFVHGVSKNCIHREKVVMRRRSQGEQAGQCRRKGSRKKKKKKRRTRSTGDQKAGLGPFCETKHIESAHERRFERFYGIGLIMWRGGRACQVVDFWNIILAKRIRGLLVKGGLNGHIRS
jgi:hypothetical protein